VGGSPTGGKVRNPIAWVAFVEVSADRFLAAKSFTPGTFPLFASRSN
jgi:hypothetical protein